MKKGCLIVLLMIMQTGYATAQSAYYKEYNHDLNLAIPADFSDCEEVHDGYLFCGVVSKTNNLGEDALLSKTDKSGDLIFRKFFNTYYHSRFDQLIDVSDGVIISGYTADQGIDRKKKTNWKFSYDGEMIWEKRYGDTTHVLFDNSVRDLCRLSDGFVVFASGFGGEETSTDAELIRFNLDGDVLWTSSFSNEQGAITNDVILQGKADKDGGFVFLMESNFPTPGYMEYFIIKTNSNGQELWRKEMTNYPVPLEMAVPYYFNNAYCVAPYKENHYMVVVCAESEYYESEKTFLVELDENGNQVAISEYLQGVYIDPQEIYIMEDNSIYVFGQGAGATTFDLYVFKVDPAGNFEWQGQYSSIHSIMQAAGIATSDGGVLIMGTRMRWETPANLGLNHCVAKTDCKGNLSWDNTSCLLPSDEEMLVFPNPVSDQLIIQLPGLSPDAEIEFRIYNATGQIVAYKKISDTQIITSELGNLSHGVYFFSIASNDNHNYKGKFIKAE